VFLIALMKKMRGSIWDSKQAHLNHI